jgi:hypothetical protein
MRLVPRFDNDGANSGILSFRHVGHDHAHFHRLTGRNLLDAKYDLVVWRRCRGLDQFPKTRQQFPFVLCRPAGTDKQSESDGGCRFTSRVSTANHIVVEDDMHPVFRYSGILGMQRCQLGGELGLGVIAQRAASVVTV